MNQEYQLALNTVILSTSDLHGNIIDFNEAFVTASGYCAEELLGKPHNILRHPDMPKEAFKDFWQTIQNGKPWFGIVKNKRKNGDYYWVAANASPICQDGKITGFISVRYPASLAQKRLAEKLYAEIRDGKASMPWTPKPSRLKTMWVAGLSLALGLGSVGFLVEQAGFGIGSGLAGLVALLSAGVLFLDRYRAQKMDKNLWQAMERLANGEFREPIEDYSDLGFGLNMIRSRMAEQSARQFDALMASESLAIALDTASSNIMVTDENFVIKRINKSLQTMFERNEAKLKMVLPDFSLASLIGSNMDAFHQNPDHQRKLLANLTRPWQGELTIAGLVLRLTVVPIMRNQQCVGYVVEWLDRTIEAGVVAEIAAVVEGVKSGDFGCQVHAPAEGVLAQIKQDLNAAMSVMQLAVGGITQIVVAQSKGDLTLTCREPFMGQLDELKQALNKSSQKLREVIDIAKKASTIVSQQAEQVSLSARELSQTVQEQAAALEETSATMDQMNSAVQHTTENAQQTSLVAQQVQSKATQGAQVMAQTIEAMNAIQQSSHKISDIVTLIDGIAFQTNLLALNAAVEAARAGEHGRGFAVVAGEVRSLAQKSAEAAKEIKDLIEESVTRIDQGTRLAAESGEMLKEITGSIDKVTEMINQIATASAEQASGIRQVHIAISQIDGVTQQNAALVEQTSEASEQLSEQARILEKDMSFFNTGANPPLLSQM